MDALMQREKVDSSQIVSIGYEPETQKLEIEFKTRSVYEYANVEPEVYAELMSAESIGRFFGQKIKSNPEKYPFTRIVVQEAGVEQKVA